MKIFSKNDMTKFDYMIRGFVFFYVFFFAFTAIFVYPSLTNSENKTIEIQEKIEIKQKEIDAAKQELDKIIEDQTIQLNK